MATQDVQPSVGEGMRLHPYLVQVGHESSYGCSFHVIMSYEISL